MFELYTFFILLFLNLQLLLSHSVVSYSLRLHGLQHARLSCPSLSLRLCSDSYQLSQWCHPTISPSVVPFSSCLQSFPALEYFPVSRLFTSGGQSIGASASASVLPMNIQGWLPLGWTGSIFWLPRGLSRAPFSMVISKLCLLQAVHSEFLCFNTVTGKRL